jgi:hypothetical protein
VVLDAPPTAEQQQAWELQREKHHKQQQQQGTSARIPSVRQFMSSFVRPLSTKADPPGQRAHTFTTTKSLPRPLQRMQSLLPTAPAPRTVSDCPLPSHTRGKGVMRIGRAHVQPQSPARRVIAFVGGLDLTSGRYDTPEHRLYGTTGPGGIHEDDFHQRCIDGGALLLLCACSPTPCTAAAAPLKMPTAWRSISNVVASQHQQPCVHTYTRA